MKKRLHCLLCRSVLALSVFFILPVPTQAQSLLFGGEQVELEAGLNFGPTFFLGDLGGNAGYGTTFIKDLNLPLTKFMKGVFVTAYPNNWLGLRLAANLTYLEGQDKQIPTDGINETYRKQRNLDFKSDVWEAYAALEFFPFDYIHRNDEEYAPRWRPYIFGGVGVFHFNPLGSLTDQAGNVTWHELQPLRTEGQGWAEYPNAKPYQLTQMNLPYGCGIKYMASDNMNIGLELLYRKTFTDYIDDVSTSYVNPNDFDVHLDAASANIARQIHDKVFGISSGVNRTEPGYQRGNPSNKDAYFSFALKIGFRLNSMYDNGNDNGRSYNQRAASRVRCPARF